MGAPIPPTGADADIPGTFRRDPSGDPTSQDCARFVKTASNQYVPFSGVANAVLSGSAMIHLIDGWSVESAADVASVFAGWVRHG